MLYRFGDFTLEADSLTLYAGQERLHAEPQVLALLALLVERAGKIVTRDEILETIWSERYVSESALSSRIKSLRQLLGDSGKEQRYLKTVHKKGFCFVAEVTQEQGKTAAARSVVGPSEKNSNIRRPRIAVLPFSNLGHSDEQQYFVDAIHHDIMAHLARHRWLEVIARNSVVGLADRAAHEIADFLDLDYWVDGNVQRLGDRIRIQVHLCQAKTHATLWSDRYDRQIDDLFALQDEITETIVARLEPEIGYSERNKILHKNPANLRAWDCYHLGVYHFFRFTAEDNLEAQKLLQQSRELDPQFAAAYAWWAYAVILGMVYWDTEPSQEHLDQALAACDQAIALDAQNAVFRALRGRVLLARKEYDAAIRENENAIMLNSSLAAAYCGLGDSLAYEKRYDEAISYFEKAIALSPNDPQLWAFYTYGALALIFKQQYEKALRWLMQASDIPNCQYWTQSHKVVALEKLGRSEEAEQTLNELIKRLPKFNVSFVREKLFYLHHQDQIDSYLGALKAVGLK